MADYADWELVQGTPVDDYSYSPSLSASFLSSHCHRCCRLIQRLSSSSSSPFHWLEPWAPFLLLLFALVAYGPWGDKSSTVSLLRLYVCGFAFLPYVVVCMTCLASLRCMLPSSARCYIQRSTAEPTGRLSSSFSISSSSFFPLGLSFSAHKTISTRISFTKISLETFSPASEPRHAARVCSRPCSTFLKRSHTRAVTTPVTVGLAIKAVLQVTRTSRICSRRRKPVVFG